jgi:uncharacterized protein YndB with AHSA1/START domain
VGPATVGIQGAFAEESEVTSKVFMSLRVPVDPARAFDAFTQEISSWWQPDPLFQLTAQGDGRLAFEPGPGGRLITRLPNGDIFEIGRISVWEPGRRLVFAWRHASFAPTQSTEVEVTFEPVRAASVAARDSAAPVVEETRVSIEHRGWDTIPQRHAARHGFPEHVTLQRVADWWRRSLRNLRPAPRGTSNQ